MKKLYAFIVCFTMLFIILTPATSTSGVDENLYTATNESGDIYVGTSEINDKLFVDWSNLEHGTIKVSVVNPDKPLRYKLVVTWEEELPEDSGPKTTQYIYNIPTGIELTTIPLQMGNGTYLIELYEQVVDTVYQPVGDIELELNSNNKDVWLEPNVKVNFSSPERLLAELDKIISPSDTEAQKYHKIIKYVHRYFSYNWIAFIKQEASPEYPDLNSVLDRGEGLCEELSALTVALLRLSGIHSRMVIGTLSGENHAWIEAIVDNKIVAYDPSFYGYELQNPVRYVPIRYY